MQMQEQWDILLIGTPVINMLPPSSPISINLPDRSVIKSTHTCTINISRLPKSTTRAHVVPDLAHTLLISIAVSWYLRCRVTYGREECKVYFENKVVWRGNRELSTKVWVLPLEPRDPSQTQRRVQELYHQANFTIH